MSETRTEIRTRTRPGEPHHEPGAGCWCSPRVERFSEAYSDLVQVVIVHTGLLTAEVQASLDAERSFEILPPWGSVRTGRRWVAEEWAHEL